MLENSDQEVNNDPVHLQVQFLINLALWTGTKTNFSSPISSKPVELCYANKKIKQIGQFLLKHRSSRDQTRR
jgi:hypothetical protein